MGLDLECWNNQRDISVISLLSQLIILTFIFSLYSQQEERRGDKTLEILLLSRFLFYYSSSSSLYLAENFCIIPFLVLLRCVSCVFYTCFLCFLWVIVDGSCSYHQECLIVMNPCLFVEEYQGLKLFRSICERIEQCRKQDT